MMPLDPRLNAYRPGLAAAELRGKVEAAHFVEPVLHQVVHGQAPLRREPRHDAPLDTEALFGECVKVFEIDDEGWAWSQIVTDHYVGYLPAAALVKEAMKRNATIREVAAEQIERGELKHKDSGAPVTLVEVDALLGDMHKLTEGGLGGPAGGG